ncbi:hypothetical protein DESUT3_23550 [Desulfuromonas versatilis]|uniref:GxxExxY protein n=1 Tax=Desulfuromonas versatilis TaxID=2802975 RepID=A0ABN6DZ85_9BACT|nr:GxxExxY protein [Desulfuromonas versatilis]BCR05286.1 hypothetical protein DESUT3_23550 [Desulfuromonas versatilis]
MKNIEHSEISDLIICSFYNVYNRLGHGFLEKVYRNALQIEMEEKDLEVESEYPISVFYKETIVGEYFADLLVNNCIVIEVKSCRKLVSEHDAQLFNYLKATGRKVGLLLNFGPKPEFRRRVFG